MNPIEFNSKILEGYLGLLDSLSPNNKLDLIAKLTESVKTDLKPKKSSFRKSFGALKSSKSAEEIIEEIRENRLFNRQIEPF